MSPEQLADQFIEALKQAGKDVAGKSERSARELQALITRLAPDLKVAAVTAATNREPTHLRALKGYGESFNLAALRNIEGITEVAKQRFAAVTQTAFDILIRFLLLL